jgi:DNA-binding FrmR family transcriptional regulator
MLYSPNMSHAAKNKEKLIVRARRIRGQVEALERALTEEQDCGDILRLITSARGAMNSLMVELLEGQIRFHVLDPNRKPSSQQAVAADGLVETMHDDHSPSQYTGGAQTTSKPPMDDDAKSVSNSVLTWMTILSFVIFGLGLSISVIFGGLQHI